MQCVVCERSSSSRLPFYCTLCAREALHDPRIQLTLILLQEEALGLDVKRNIARQQDIRPGIHSKTGTNAQEPSPSWALDRATAEHVASDERTDAILSHVQALRTQTEYIKAEISRRRKNLARRRSKLGSAVQNLPQRETNAIEPMERGIKRIEHRWDTLHAATLEARVFLCKEAAQLYGLQQRKRKRGPGKDVYVIGGIPIADLRELNNVSPAHVTTSTTNLAHLVYLISHYLTLRLPAEITLPHRDYPLPTIFSPGSSYTMREVPFPGSTSSQSSNNSPSASRTVDSQTLPRPRPLHIEKKLPVLAKEDPVAYALFVEGMTLLAWDIAWICKTQGLSVGDNSWEEVCAMGRNLWQLLAAASPVPRPPISREVSRQGSATTPSITSRRDEATTANDTKGAQPPAKLGHYSHGTTHSFLATAEGMEYIRGWRLQSPVKVIEKVKALLLSERTGAEWEILEETEWEEKSPHPSEAATKEASVEEEAVLIKGRKKTGGFDEGRSIISTVTGVGEEADERGKGTNGWTKVKSRGGP